MKLTASSACGCARGSCASAPVPLRPCAFVCACALVLLCSASFGAPQVSNVRFAQQNNSNIVDIWYTLASPVSCSVSVRVSTDGGATWGIAPSSAYGDVGSFQAAGTDKHITWDAGKDYPNLKAIHCQVCVTADDGIAPPPAPTPIPASSPTPARAPTPITPSAPSGMTFLRTNGQGYEEYLWPKDSSVMVKIPAGSFVMGSGSGDGDEKPMHSVTLSEYYIDKNDVTNRQYRMFCDATGRGYPDDPGFSGHSDYFITCPNCPVVNVSWNDAKAYCDWAGKRLPTEAEWEKAARGTDGRKYPWGSTEPDFSFCNFNNHVGNPTEVGSYSTGASPYGCMDMAGNVWQWCNDWYDANYYSSSANSNPQGPSSGSSRVFRGGGWINYASSLRCANRYWFTPAYRSVDLGFRCARSE